MTEFELIARITDGLPSAAPGLFLGAGDDCAVVAGPEGRDWLVTADALLEGVHFRREWGDLETLGRKALAVNLSDIAAMGGTARFFLVTLGVPPGMEAGDVLRLNRGMAGLAAETGALLIGGDTTASCGGLALSITAIGEAPRGGAVLRSGARPGDAIFITGQLGGSALGLSLLGRSDRPRGAEPFLLRHLDPVPRLAAGRILREGSAVTAMIDVSDGLMADLGHIADASGCGFELDGPAVPLPEGVAAMASAIGADARQLSLAGGEDYELCFAVRPERAQALLASWDAAAAGCPIACIGRMVADPRARRALDEAGLAIPLPAAGFDHFAKSGALR